jgi:hypothetical protein
MGDFLRFQMEPRKDLSGRADFTFDLVKEVASRLQEAVDAVDAVKKMKDQARVDVLVTHTLSDIDVKIKVTPLTDEDIDAAVGAMREAVRQAIDEKMKETIGASLQKAIDSSRSRM